MTTSADTSAGAPARCGIRTGHETKPRDCGAVALITVPEADAGGHRVPDGTHEELVAACLEAGKPVLCEKPLVRRRPRTTQAARDPRTASPRSPSDCRH